MGPKKILRLVAKYGDACNFFGASEDEVLKDRLDVLKRHCEDLGRPLEEIEKNGVTNGGLRGRQY
jgi:hypothetical protein